MNTSSRSGYIYLIGSSAFGWYKIGKAKSAHIRIRNLGILLPFKIHVFAVWGVEDRTLCEARMHDHFAEDRINGEWFTFSWEKITGMIDGSGLPIVGELTYSCTDFSNLDEDRLENSYDAKAKKAKADAWRAGVEDFLQRNELEKSKENLKLAREYMKAKWKPGTMHWLIKPVV